MDVDSDDDDVCCLDDVEHKSGFQEDADALYGASNSGAVDEASLLRLIDDVRRADEFDAAASQPCANAASPQLVSQEDAPIVLDDDELDDDDVILMDDCEPPASASTRPTRKSSFLGSNFSKNFRYLFSFRSGFLFHSHCRMTQQSME